MSPKITLILLICLIGGSICTEYTIEVAENKFSVEHIYEKLGTLVHKVRAGKSIFEVVDLNDAISQKFIKVTFRLIQLFNGQIDHQKPCAVQIRQRGRYFPVYRTVSIVFGFSGL